MKDDPPSSFSGLREEWSLLVHSFIDQSEDQKLKVQDLTPDQLSLIQKNLSQQRQLLNQKIEAINNQMETLNAVIETLTLVGADTTHVQNELVELNLLGEKTSTEIFNIEMKIKKVHELKENLVTLTQLLQA